MGERITKAEALRQFEGTKSIEVDECSVLPRETHSFPGYLPTPTTAESLSPPKLESAEVAAMTEQKALEKGNEVGTIVVQKAEEKDKEGVIESFGNRRSQYTIPSPRRDLQLFPRMKVEFR